MKINVLVLSFILAGVSHLATAADGQINFIGNITATTCSINSGTPTQTVNLGDVPASSLASTGQTAGHKSFALNLTGCTGGMTAVGARFESLSLANSNGRLNLDAASDAAGVEVAIYDSIGTPQSVNGNIPDESYVMLDAGSATLNYIAAYYATGPGPAEIGSANSAVSYTLSYR
ncbi:hypothetical protein B4916_22020 [Yersinia intermedia]|nr:hypothetical protein B4916_22020 [Yersinia intermedia]